MNTREQKMSSGDEPKRSAARSMNASHGAAREGKGCRFFPFSFFRFSFFRFSFFGFGFFRFSFFRFSSFSFSTAAIAEGAGV